MVEIGVGGGEGRSRRAPSEARLQLARRPLITGEGSSQAFFADSASLNVTCKETQNPNPSQLARSIGSECGDETEAYEAIALGTAGGLIGDDDGFENITESGEVVTQNVLLGLPCESADEDLGERGVAEWLLAHCLRRPMRRSLDSRR